MLKTQSLCTGAKTNLKDRILGEVEKINFIVCQAKGDRAGPHLWKLCLFNSGELDEEFYD